MWRKTGRRFAILGCILLGILAEPGVCSAAPPPNTKAAPLPESALVFARRIAVLSVPPEPEDIPVKAWLIAQQQLSAEQRQTRRTGEKQFVPLVTLAPKAALAPKPEASPRRAGGLWGFLSGGWRTGTQKPPKPTRRREVLQAVTLSPREQRQAALVTLSWNLVAAQNALVNRLHKTLKTTLVPESEIRAALAALHLTRAEAVTPEGAQKLCARLDCDALLVLTLDGYTLREGARREAAVWLTARGFGETFEVTFSLGEPEELVSFAPPNEFMVCGMAEAGHHLLRSGYADQKFSLAQRATEQAMARAVHTLRTGEMAPMMRRGTRVALAPLPAPPSQADKLIFSAEGRRVQTVALPEAAFGARVAFAPDTRPVFSEDIVGPEEVKQTLRQSRLTPAALWAQESAPNIARVQALGRRLGVDYVLLARITDIQLDEGPLTRIDETIESVLSTTQPPTDLRERQARAEAVGALVRVQDGKLLWQSRTTTSMIARPVLNGKPIPLRSDAEVAQDAARFALIQLQRDFQRYRAGFEK